MSACPTRGREWQHVQVRTQTFVCSPSLARAHRHVAMAASWEEDPCMSVHGRVSRGRTVRRACQGGNPGTRIERELRTFSLHCSPFHFCISVSLPCSPFSCSLGSPLLSQYTPATGIPSSSRCGRHRVQSDADRILCCAGILAGGLDSVPRGKEVPNQSVLVQEPPAEVVGSRKAFFAS